MSEKEPQKLKIITIDKDGNKTEENEAPGTKRRLSDHMTHAEIQELLHKKREEIESD